MPSVPSQGPATGNLVLPVGLPAARRTLTLSPSRAGDFKRCPLLYRLRAIDRIAEPPSRPAVRGTLVHAALEQLFAADPADRTQQVCIDLLRPIWDQLSSDPSVAALVAEEEKADWLAGAAALIRSYFTLENPSAFTPEACEMAVTVELPDPGGPIPLKGFIDRLDVAANGEIRIVDYKTGRSPSQQWEAGSFYQLKFYALMVYRLRGVLPTELKVIYLADSTALRYRTDLTELLAFERGVVALWAAISSAAQSGDFPANRSAACGRCSHHSRCPEFGGTPPPYVGMAVGTVQLPG